MSEIKNGGLDQYDAEPFEQQQFGAAGVEGVNTKTRPTTGNRCPCKPECTVPPQAPLLHRDCN